MSAQPLQERVISVIRDNQPLRRADLAGWLKDVDSILLDTCVNALMRANKVSLTGGYFDLVQQIRPAKAEKLVCVGTPTAPINGSAIAASVPPTAAEEAASSLNGQPQLFDCERCHNPKPDEAFPHSKLGTRFKVCRRCNAQLRGVQEPKLSPAHTPPRAPTAPEESGAPAISTEPPAKASAQGTQAPELALAKSAALSPVSAGPDSIVMKLRAQLAELARDVEELPKEIERLTQQKAEYEQLLKAKRIALFELNDFMARLQKLVPEAFV